MDNVLKFKDRSERIVGLMGQVLIDNKRLQNQKQNKSI